MKTNKNIIYKIAVEPYEFEAIHRLNYRTFVQEIPQHEQNSEQRLVDKFHNENTYIICVSDKQLLGMIALRGSRPFSLDAKLDDFEVYLPQHQAVCEVRLLAVDLQYRDTSVVPGLFITLMRVAIQQGYDLAVISGYVKQLRLYTNLGFESFGPTVGTEQALYQPMYIHADNVKRLDDHSRLYKRVFAIKDARPVIHNYLPGPVDIQPAVRQMFSSPAVSHRSEQFIEDMSDLKQRLCQLVQADNVQILMGSGTLSNDLVAAQLSLLNGAGLILENGEFGCRLIDQAERASLDFKVHHSEEGKAFSGSTIEKHIHDNPSIQWIWMTHCETSTGVMNDLVSIKSICKQFGIKLCIDCISSIGACPVDLTDVYLATAVSGKALASRAGLALVFHADDVLEHQGKLPRSLDLKTYHDSQGVPYTISSNQLYALKASIDTTDWEYRYQQIKVWSQILRRLLKTQGYVMVADECCAAPHVISIKLPESVSSKLFGDMMETSGILLSYNSRYLISENIIQICFMGHAVHEIESLIQLMKKVYDKCFMPEANKETYFA